MKTLISILFAMMIAGCGTPTTESVTGSYEYKLFDTHKVVFLQNGVGEDLLPRGDKKEFKWAIESGRLLMTAKNGNKVIIKRKWDGVLRIRTISFLASRNINIHVKKG